MKEPRGDFSLKASLAEHGALSEREDLHGISAEERGSLAGNGAEPVDYGLRRRYQHKLSGYDYKLSDYNKRSGYNICAYGELDQTRQRRSHRRDSPGQQRRDEWNLGFHAHL
jgi:hypothetical protein